MDNEQRTTHELLLPLVDRLFNEKIKPLLKPAEPEYRLINPVNNSTYSIRISWTGIHWRVRQSDDSWSSMDEGFEATLFLLENLEHIFSDFELTVRERHSHAKHLITRANKILDELS